MVKKCVKIVLLAILLLIVYLVTCCLLIPAFQKSVNHPLNLQMPGENAEAGAQWERVASLDDNMEALERRLQLIESAEKELIFSTYNLKPDTGGRDVLSAIMAAAKRGVHVRMIIDGMNGTLDLADNEIFNTLAACENIEVRIYNPFDLWRPWSLNYRLHDKYIVADEQVYILGGRNTRNISLGDYQDTKDYDRDVLVYNGSQREDSSLLQVKAYFEEMWELPETKPYDPLKGKPDMAVVETMENHYQGTCERHPSMLEKINWEEITMPTNGIMLISNPISAWNKEPVVWASLQELMKKGEDIVIETPYVVCNKQMYKDLESLSDGRQVTIITNSPESGANVCGSMDYVNQRKKVYGLGATVYEYVGDRSRHTKTVLIDDNISIVGSFNFDMRSTYLDTETMLVIDCPELNAQLRSISREYMARSRQMMPDGTAVPGSEYVERPMPADKDKFLRICRYLVWPIRHLV